MNFEQLLKLVDAGFTKSDIMALQKPTEAKPEAETVATPEAKTEAKPEPKQDLDFRTAFDAMSKRIDDLCKSMISNNISTATQPTNTENSVSDILKGLF